MKNSPKSCEIGKNSATTVAGMVSAANPPPLLSMSLWWNSEPPASLQVTLLWGPVDMLGAILLLEGP